MEKKNIIVCPYCGAEYLPEEIYIPSDFLGSVKDIVKDDQGKILSFVGQPMNLKEEYTCDSCNHRFSVTANVTFKVAPCVEHDFNYDYSTKLYDHERESLKED